ncbi:MAG: 5-dehydro-4-deoxy-D-glucuronate isomerase [Bacteroidales bacterium]|jgi:4-deoxy-L-threo-5-hexosulose-uronate ketol-isomerase
MKSEIKYAVHPSDFIEYKTERIRNEFLFEDVFIPDEISLIYSLYDRFIIGGTMPVGKSLALETFDELKAAYFLERRELGLINTGGPGLVEAGGVSYEIGHKEALYLGKGVKNVSFRSASPKNPALFYFNSAPAHHAYPSRKVTGKDAVTAVVGTAEKSNCRTINKLLINDIVQTCQLQMGLTELKPGSVWNTMPVHTHGRRMETYFYFEVPADQAICHFMGKPEETRHIWVRNNQAVISPSWSIHSAAGTSNYSFIWGMAGENIDYDDMDIWHPDSLR